MGILNNIQIELHTDRVTRALARGSAKRFLTSAVGQAVESARPLIKPAGVYAWGHVRSLDSGKVGLHWQDQRLETVLHPGPHVDLIALAEIALVSVVTIGGALDLQARRLHRAGDTLQAYLLDCVGVVALSETGRVLRRMAEVRAAAASWGVGPSVAPGSLDGWNLAEQSALCEGLNLRAIGVYLNASGVLEPFKSASGLIGLGPGYRSRKVGSPCRHCMHAATCWRAELSESS